MLKSGLGFIIASLLIPCTVNQAQFIPIFGGPAYTPPDGGLFGGAWAVVNDSGTVFAAVDKTIPANVGWRMTRWNPTDSPILLNHLGTDSTGFTRASPKAVNGSGTAIGQVFKYDMLGNDLGLRVARWNSTSTAIEELGIFETKLSGFSEAYPGGINAAGTAVGTVFRYDNAGEWFASSAVRWDASGTTPIALDNLQPHPSGAYASGADAINAAGVVTGSSDQFDLSGNSVGRFAVRWDAGGTAITRLNIAGTGVNNEGYTYAYGNAINSAGMIVGQADTFTPTHGNQGVRAIRWNPGETAGTILQPLGTAPDGVSFAYAQAVNDQGTTLGLAEKFDALGVSHGQRAVIWKATENTPKELAVLSTDINGNGLSWANDMNQLGIIVGASMDPTDLINPRSRAVYWTPDASVVDLNTLIDPASGWFLDTAYSVSDTGWIAGVGLYDPDGPEGVDPQGRSFLLQIPEPGSLALTGCGLMFLLKRKSR